MNQLEEFKALGLSDDILTAIAKKGFETPSAIQSLTIPHLLTTDKDIIAQAQTGTGKTAAFGLPIIQMLTSRRNIPQAIVLVPTRELALQVTQELISFNTHDLSIAPIYGGASMTEQLRRLKKGIDIVVGTPGRILDHIRRGTLDLSAIAYLVLDEADEMLNMGFLDSINAILSKVPQERKMLLFSATMPKEIEQIARTYMHEPKEVVVGSRNEGAENVRHVYYMVHAKDKYPALKRIADYYPNIYGIIFCRTRRETQEIADQLIADGYNADSLHGELSQAQRDAVMQKFRLRNLQLLVATDVAARGLDVTDLTHVINYGLPDDIETYTHRSGRTGRAGKSGVSVAIVHSREKGKMRAIEKIIGKKFERGMVPTGEQICEKQLFNLADRIEKVKVNEEEIAKYLPNISRKLGWLTEQDLIKRIVSLEFNRLIDYYRDTPDLDIPDENTRKPKEGNFAKEGRNGRKKDIRTAEAGFERIYINLGKAHGFFPPNLIEMVNSLVPGRVNIGRIDLLSSYSLFDVEKSSAQKVVGALKGNEFYGHRIYAELATDKDYSAPKGKRKGKEEGGRRTNEKRYGNSRRDHSESRSRRDRSSSKTKRSSYSSKKRKG